MRGGGRGTLMLTLAAAAALAVVVVFALAAPQAQDPQWQPAQTFAPTPSPRSLRLESGASGQAVAVWLAREAGGVAPYASAREPGGHFQPPQRLADPGRLSDLELAAGRVGDAVAVWRRQGPSGVRVEGARRQAAQPFAPPLVLAEGARPGIAVAIDASARAEVMWTTPPGPGRAGARMLLRNWPAQAALEAPRVVVRAGPRPLGVGALAAGEQETLAVALVGGRAEAVVAPVGAAPARPRAVSARGAARPVLAADRRGDAVLAWRRAGRVEFATRPATGGFGRPVRPGAGDRLAAAIDEEGIVSVAFHGPRGTMVAGADARSPGDAAVPAELVVPGAAAAVGVEADVQGTTQLLVVRPGGALLAVARPWLQGWQTPHALARSGGAGARLAASAAGTALVAWPLSDEIRGAIRALPGAAAYSPLVTR